jgi:hypothetical protein
VVVRAWREGADPRLRVRLVARFGPGDDEQMVAAAARPDEAAAILQRWLETFQLSLENDTSM